MTAKKKSALAEVLEVIANSEIGHTLNEKLRGFLSLPNPPPADDKMRGEARKMGAKIRSQMKDDPYVILGVDQGADIVVIKAAYRALAKKYHPDSGTTPDGKMMKRINLAYEAIMKERGEPK